MKQSYFFKVSFTTNEEIECEMYFANYPAAFHYAERVLLGNRRGAPLAPKSIVWIDGFCTFPDSPMMVRSCTQGYIRDRETNCLTEDYAHFNSDVPMPERAYYRDDEEYPEE